MSTKEIKKVAGWANFPVMEAEIFESADRARIRGYVLEHERLIARGNGKSYGDASLSPHILSTLALNKILHFDPKSGIVTCEAGVLLADLLPLIVPAGWFFHVTPGIKDITVGGAIASDVHGKNHLAKGCFSNWLLSFELMLGNGEVVTCSKTENATLFWQTCGGMGWTGVILSATFQLMRISSVRMSQETVHCKNLEQLFDAFEANKDREYAAAWVDTTSKGAGFGRGVLHFARHIEEDETPLEWQTLTPRTIGFYAPSWVLNPLSIRIHNMIYKRSNPEGERQVHMDKYFYPLDKFRHWNRLYGRRGFVQYQFCIPEENAREGFAALLHRIEKSRDTAFLSVMKRHGERPTAAVNSFPIKGYSLALDFPRTGSILKLIEALDNLVWDFGGKIYLTKDACSQARLGRVDMQQFGEEKFWSGLRGRVTIK